MKRLCQVMLVLGAFTGCGVDDVCACPPVDTSMHLVVQGVVVDSGGLPVVGTELSPLGVLNYDCAVSTNPVRAEPTPAVSGSDGRFRMVLGTWDGGGTHCLSLLVHHEPSAFVDTIPVRARFVRTVEVPDTVSLQVTVSSPQ